MKRQVVAALWITAATVPVLLATVFLVGCCVLPFHRVMHKLMPICEMAASVMRGETHAGHDGNHDAVPPAREKQEPVKRIAAEAPFAFRLVAVSAVSRVVASPTSSYRSFITLGAIRCDRDVGLHVLDNSFLV